MRSQGNFLQPIFVLICAGDANLSENIVRQTEIPPISCPIIKESAPQSYSPSCAPSNAPVFIHFSIERRLCHRDIGGVILCSDLKP